MIEILNEIHLQQGNLWRMEQYISVFSCLRSVFSPLDVTKSYTLDLEAGVNQDAPGIHPCQAATALIHITYSNCFNGLFIWSGAQFTRRNIRQKATAHTLGLYLQWCQSEITMDRGSCSRKVQSLSKGSWAFVKAPVVGKCTKGCNLKQSALPLHILGYIF